MSSTVVATVAWLALAAAVGIGALLVVLYRRTTALSREQTDRKWELAVLRAEVGDLRRRLRAGGEDPDGTPAPIPEQAAGEPEPDGGRATTRTWPSSPTAWRRDRARAPARPRRRRPG